MQHNGPYTGLARYYSPETIAKLQRLAEWTAYQDRFTAFAPKLAILEWCAFLLASVNNQVSQFPLNTIADLPVFLNALDQAGQEIAQMFDADGGEEDAYYDLALTIHQYGYGLSSHYQERKARIQQAGKLPLLWRFTLRFAARDRAS